LPEVLIQVADVKIIEPDVAQFRELYPRSRSVVRAELPFVDTQAAREAADSHPDYDPAEATRLARHPAKAAVMPVIERTKNGDTMIAGWTTWEMLNGKAMTIPVLLVGY
jgi:acetyl-CoA carboxylase alpha subunit